MMNNSQMGMMMFEILDEEIELGGENLVFIS
jgi:hypothetical protein